ncbi:MAG: HAD hydrolase-like protein, partial [Pedosphaera parvula]|nr:HAD hydrolase-like protein [Pedosphaera parvula]
MKPSLIQTITFDVGGTLIEPWPSVGHVYAEVAGRFGVDGVAVEALNQRFAAAWRAKVNFDYSQPAWFELVRQTFGEHARTLPDDYFPALYERFAEPDAWRTYDDVVPALEQLATSGLRLAVISNWDDRLHVLLERLNLRHFFERVIVSCDVG